jgi:tripartite-type tricarboxylate transporter receptor subunit TctC
MDYKITNIKGAGGSKAAVVFTKKAKPTGQEWMITSGSLAMNYVIKGDEKAGYNYNAWRPMISLSTGGTLVSNKSLGSLADIIKNKPKLTNSGLRPHSWSIITPVALAALGLDVTMVWGNGSSASYKAFKSGETNIDHQSVTGYKKRYEKDDSVNTLFTWGAYDGDKIVRDPDYPNIPHFTEVLLANGLSTDTIEYRAWKLIFNTIYATKSFMVVPKDTPQAATKKYLAAYKKAFSDKEFIAEFTKKSGKSGLLVGAAAQKKYDIAFKDMDKEALAWLRDFIAKNYK